MAEPLRIVHCFRNPIGGLFRHVRDLAEAQTRAGHKVGIVCDSNTGGDYEDKLFDAIRPTLALGVTRTPMQRHVGLGDAAAAWKTMRILRALEPDVLHGHGAKGGVYARFFGTILRLRGRRVARIYTPHGGSLHYDADAPMGRVFFGLERLMEHVTDHLLFVSGYELETFRRKVGAPRVPYKLVFNGLREAEFEPVRTERGAADFLYIGMMRDLKGPDLFIDALALAERQAGRPITAAMVGDGDDLPSYKARVERLGLADRVRFSDAMPARLGFALGRCIVVPSRAEAMPYIVLEALAAGKPMIASAVGGIPEIFGDSRSTLVRPDFADIARLMCEALSEGEAFGQRMPDPSVLRARFSSATMADAIEGAYRTALGAAPREVSANLPRRANAARHGKPVL